MTVCELVHHDVPGGLSPRAHFTRPDAWCWCDPCRKGVWAIHHQACDACGGYGNLVQGDLVWDRACPECKGVGWHPCSPSGASSPPGSPCGRTAVAGSTAADGGPGPLTGELAGRRA